MAVSFLSPADIADLEDISWSALLTDLELQGGGTSLVLARWNADAQDWLPIAPAPVSVAYDNLQPRDQTSDSATERIVTGTFSSLVPWDVRIDDRFSLGPSGDEQRGRIALVLPPELGVQSAKFELDAERR
jgi:hypothetical protein